MNTIPEILADLRAGKMILLIDDEDRENEGDLICAAEAVTPQIINFMLREGRGMLFVALDGTTCDRLDLSPQSTAYTTQRGTAYTVSVDAASRYGITTGVSAADRATTVKLLADATVGPDDFDRPGHVQPLRARSGGVLVRAGHTEGATDLCAMAGMRPAAVGIEVMNEDGSMSRLDDLKRVCVTHDLKICTVADVIQHRLSREKLVERMDSIPLQTPHGPFTLIAYRSMVDPLPHVALVCGDLGKLDDQGRVAETTDPVLIRMHSQNLLGDVFGDLTQPSGQTLQHAMKMIQQEGRGAIVYLRHAGMGTGLLRTLQTHRDEEDRIAIARHQTTPGTRPPDDKGAYGIGSQILRDLGVTQIRLITNHPFHPTALGAFGLQITEFVSVQPASANTPA